MQFSEKTDFIGTDKMKSIGWTLHGSVLLKLCSKLLFLCCQVLRLTFFYAIIMHKKVSLRCACALAMSNLQIF